MLIGAVADIHGNFEALARAIERHPDVPAWFCVGDLASAAGAYPTPAAPLYWIKGNNEQFDRIADWEPGRAAVANRHHHRFAETTCEGVRSVCLDRVNRSYLLIEAGTLAYRLINQ